jgi:deoxycytidine triphosphate deaminase/intein/homing endonuclease
MSVKSDRWIRRMAREHKMIEPFADAQVREGVISYGVSSYGYDMRIADEFKIFTNINSTIVDPKNFDPRSFVDFKGDVCVIPPNSFALARSVEYFRIPRNVITICLGKCCSSDTQVLDAASGRLEPISVLGGRGGCTASLRDDVIASADVSEGVSKGVMPVYLVVTRTGRRIRTTAAHPFLTFTGWQPLRTLRPGARIAVPKRIEVFGSRSMAACEIDLLGLLISDGACKYSPPRYISGDEILREWFASAVRDFGCLPRRRRPTDIAAINEVDPSGRRAPNRLHAWLEALGLAVNSPQKFVPRCVFELSRPLLARFLRALFSGDGGISMSGEGIHLEFCSTSEALARDVHHLLLRFGVVAGLRHRETASGRGAYVLSVTSKEHILRFAREIGFITGCHKQRRLEEALDKIEHAPQQKSNYDTLPPEAWELLRFACATREASLRSMGLERTQPDQSVPRWLARDLAYRLSDERLGSIASSDLLWDTIREIRFDGVERVYDLTLPTTANFVANDIVVHNSTYARCGIIVNVTPFEPEWEGIVTLEVSNTTPLPAKIYANEGIAQVLFFEGDEVCETSYADKKGKYQAQKVLTLPKL